MLQGGGKSALLPFLLSLAFERSLQLLDELLKLFLRLLRFRRLNLLLQLLEVTDYKTEECGKLLVCHAHIFHVVLPSALARLLARFPLL